MIGYDSLTHKVGWFGVGISTQPKQCFPYIHNYWASKRMVWLTIPCKLLRKDKLCEHKRSQCHADAVQVEAIASAANSSIIANISGISSACKEPHPLKAACNYLLTNF